MDTNCTGDELSETNCVEMNSSGDELKWRRIVVETNCSGDE